MTGRLARRVVALLGLGVVLAVGSPFPAGSERASTSAPRIASELGALLSGERPLDPRIAALLPGRRPTALPYFVVLGEPKRPAHRRALELAGARVLHDYRALDAYAVLSPARVAQRVAGMPFISRRQPVELVRDAADQEQDQTRATTADVGALAAWAQGLTGRGIRIAVLDTGLDPSHQDLDEKFMGYDLGRIAEQ